MWGLKSSSAPTLYWLSPRPASFLRLSAEDTEADTVKANTRLEEELNQCHTVLSPCTSSTHLRNMREGIP